MLFSCGNKKKKLGGLSTERKNRFCSKTHFTFPAGALRCPLGIWSKEDEEFLGEFEVSVEWFLDLFVMLLGSFMAYRTSPRGLRQSPMGLARSPGREASANVCWNKVPS